MPEGERISVSVLAWGKKTGNHRIFLCAPALMELGSFSCYFISFYKEEKEEEENEHEEGEEESGKEGETKTDIKETVICL